MGVLSRFKAIFQAKASQVVDQMEDPKASLDYSLVKLEDSRRQIGRSLVEVSAARTRLEHQRDELVAAAQKYAGQAEAAVGAGRDDLARTALERKQEAQARRAELETNIANLERQAENLKQSQANLERKIALFRDVVTARKQVADILRLVNEVDVDSFVTIQEARQVVQGYPRPVHSQ